MSEHTLTPIDTIDDCDAGGFDVVHFVMGERGELTPSTCREHALAWKRLRAANPKAIFLLMVMGYDDDPRELWEFPEVREYVQSWAGLVGLDDYDAAVAVFSARPIAQGYAPEAVHEVIVNTVGLLNSCGVFGDVHPGPATVAN
jgi:hypothetical protein